MRKTFSRHTISAMIALSWLMLCPLAAGAHDTLHEQIQDVTREIAVDPQDANLYWRRGELYRLDRDAAAASADYDRALELNPSLDLVYLGRAFLKRDMGHLRDALQSVDRFLRLNPDHAPALFLRAKVLAGDGRFDDAVDAMNRAIAVAPRVRPEAYIERARWLVDRPRADAQKLQDAVEGLDDGLSRLGPVVTMQLVAIELQESAGRYDDALSRLARLIAVYPRKEILLVRRAEILDAAGRELDAQAAYTDALDAIVALAPGVRSTRAVADLESRVRTRMKVVPKAGSHD